MLFLQLVLSPPQQTPFDIACVLSPASQLMTAFFCCVLRSITREPNEQTSCTAIRVMGEKERERKSECQERKQIYGLSFASPPSSTQQFQWGKQKKGMKRFIHRRLTKKSERSKTSTWSRKIDGEFCWPFFSLSFCCASSQLEECTIVNQIWLNEAGNWGLQMIPFYPP